MDKSGIAFWGLVALIGLTLYFAGGGRAVLWGVWIAGIVLALIMAPVTAHAEMSIKGKSLREKLLVDGFLLVIIAVIAYVIGHFAFKLF
jgi:hypothetical protein